MLYRLHRMGSASELIKEARSTAGLTQSQLATAAGMTQQAISSYERGMKQPSLPTLAKLIQAAGLEMSIGIVQPGATPPSHNPDDAVLLRQRLADQARINWIRGR